MSFFKRNVQWKINLFNLDLQHTLKENFKIILKVLKTFQTSNKNFPSCFLNSTNDVCVLHIIQFQRIFADATKMWENKNKHLCGMIRFFFLQTEIFISTDPVLALLMKNTGQVKVLQLKRLFWFIIVKLWLFIRDVLIN